MQQKCFGSFTGFIHRFALQISLVDVHCKWNSTLASHSEGVYMSAVCYNFHFVEKKRIPNASA
jgi:hypothetical protein